MSGFIGQAATQPFVLSNDPFFPEIDANALRASVRLSGDVSDERLETAIVDAMLTTNRELKAKKAEWLAAGHASLAHVDPSTIADRNVLEQLYTRAVRALVAAEFAERYRGYDATQSGVREDEELGRTSDDFRRDYRHALRDLLGTRHATIELI